MKRFLILPLLAGLGLVLLTSCSALRSGSPVKAGYASEDASWASRHIPGVKALSDFIPPPTEGRMRWDEWQKKRNDPGGHADTMH